MSQNRKRMKWLPTTWHHFVPAFLLREWESAPDQKLSAFHWVNGKLDHQRYKAKSVAKEAGLYALRGADGVSDNRIETEFFTPEIDNRAALVHRRIIEAGYLALTQQERYIWCRFVVAQMLRTRRMLGSLKEKGAKALQASLEAKPEEYDEIKVDSDPDGLSEWAAQNLPALTGENFALAALPSIVDSELLNDVMRNASCGTIARGNAPFDFVISDHPLLYVGKMDEVFLVALPISPAIAFVAFSHEETARRIKSSRTRRGWET